MASIKAQRWTYKFFIENIERLVKPMVGYRELLFQTRCACKCRFRSQVVGGGEQPSGGFELFVGSGLEAKDKSE